MSDFADSRLCSALNDGPADISMEDCGSDTGSWRSLELDVDTAEHESVATSEAEVDETKAMIPTVAADVVPNSLPTQGGLTHIYAGSNTSNGEVDVAIISTTAVDNLADQGCFPQWEEIVWPKMVISSVSSEMQEDKVLFAPKPQKQNEMDIISRARAAPGEGITCSQNLVSVGEDAIIHKSSPKLEAEEEPNLEYPVNSAEELESALQVELCSESLPVIEEPLTMAQSSPVFNAESACGRLANREQNAKNQLGPAMPEKKVDFHINISKFHEFQTNWLYQEKRWLIRKV